MRPSHDEWGLRLAEVVAQRATCLRRSVGCVLTNARHQVLSTGYNGRASGLKHCDEAREEGRGYKQFGDDPSVQKPTRIVTVYPPACAGARAPSGHNLDGCEAIHAEQNALLQCRNVYEINICYVTVSPCVTCVKLLLNTGCMFIVFREPYAHDEASRLLWLSDRRAWIHLPCAA